MPPGMPAPYSPIDAISYALRKFGENVGIFLLMGVLTLVAGGGVQFIFNLAGGGLEVYSNPINPDNPSSEASLASSMIQLTGLVLSSLLSWIVGLALLRGALDVVDTGRVDLGQMFSRVPWGQGLLAGLLVGIAVFLGLFALCVGAIVVAFFLYYTNAAVLDGTSAVDAIKASFTFVKENLVDNLLLCLILGVGGVVLSFCTCGIAGVVVAPVTSLAIAYTWRVLQSRPVVA